MKVLLRFCGHLLSGTSSTMSGFTARLAGRARSSTQTSCPDPNALGSAGVVSRADQRPYCLCSSFRCSKAGNKRESQAYSVRFLAALRRLRGDDQLFDPVPHPLVVRAFPVHSPAPWALPELIAPFQDPLGCPPA